MRLGNHTANYVIRIRAIELYKKKYLTAGRQAGQGVGITADYPDPDSGESGRARRLQDVAQAGLGYRSEDTKYKWRASPGWINCVEETQARTVAGASACARPRPRHICQKPVP